MEFYLEIAKLILSRETVKKGATQQAGFCGPKMQISDAQRQGLRGTFGGQGTASEEVGRDVRLRLS